jgi:hypothetical protein
MAKCIKSLPTELLNEVFVQYTLSKETSAGASNLLGISTRATRYGCIAIPGNPHANPIVLGHVCSQWRALSLSMPVLWSKIGIRQPSVKDVPIVKTWLQRSGAVPLDLKVIQAFPGYNNDLDGMGQGILHLVLAERHRWKSVEIRLFNSTVQSIEFPADLGPTPALESAKLDLVNASSLDLCDMLFSSPVLQRAEFKIQWTHKHTIKWLLKSTSQITHLKFSYIDPSSVIALLRECPALREMSCGVVHRPRVMPVDLEARLPPRRPFSHPTLHTLRIGKMSPSDLAGYWDGVALPLLRDLSISAIAGPESPNMRAWLSVSRLLEQCQIQALTIPCAFNDETALVHFLQSASVATLTLTTKVSDTTLRALTFAPLDDDGEDHSPPILPRMSHLKLDWCSSSNGVLSRLILSRKDVLRTVEASLRGPSFGTDLSISIPGIKVDLAIPGWVDGLAGEAF